MNYTKILYAAANGVATITLNCPVNLNAFDEGMTTDVLAALDACGNDDSVKVVVLGAQGKAFSGGGDIVEMVEGLKRGTVVFDVTADKIAQVSLAIKKLRKPVVASVRGAVAGAAFNIILACDFCVAAENAKFIQAFVNIGLIPDAGGLYLLSRAVGVNKAMHLALTGAVVTAVEGENLGFVYKTCPVDALDEETAALASRLAAGPSLAYAAMKELMFASQFADFEQYLPKEVRAQLDSGYTTDFREGVTAFLEKRTAQFTGT